MKLKFVPFCSPSKVLLHGMSFFRRQKCQFLAENHGLKSMVLIEFISTLERAIELTFAQFCSS